jgi:PAS domain S-box-containing protein
MFSDSLLLLVSLAYLGLLFTIAYYGDRRAAAWRGGATEPVIYALSLAIYCTSWTFYGSVGRAAASGMDFLLIYVGPVLVITAGYPLLRKIITVARAQNVTSIADFIGARYGKSRVVAATATMLAVVGVMPYIALQLQAASLSFNALVGVPGVAGSAPAAPLFPDSAIYIAFVMAVFSILFGVRHVQASERHHGMILAVAFESLVKLGALLAVGLFVVFGMYDGLGDWQAQAFDNPAIRGKLDVMALGPSALAITLVSALAFICLPRQFHVAVVESGGARKNLRAAAWLFPLYLVAINLFVPVLAAAGLLRLDPQTIPDLYVLALPMSAGQSLLSLFVFIGGLSAATSMVIVASVALSAMISNELVMPFVLRHFTFGPDSRGIGELLLMVRRVTILLIFSCAYLYYQAINGRYPLASIGLISFSAVAQFGPALVFGLFWRRAHRHGALAGMVGGALVWANTLLLPSFHEAGWLLSAPLFGGELPSFSLALDPLTIGVLWSLTINIMLLVGVSLLSSEETRDRRQAAAFVDGPEGVDPATPVPAGRAATFDDLKGLAGRLLGADVAEAAFAGPVTSYRDGDLADFTERLLSGAIGAASARIMVAAATRRRGGRRAILNDASEAILFNRDLLRATLENVSQGIAMFDAESHLAAWNQRLLHLIGLPDSLARIGTPLSAIVRHAAMASPGLDLSALVAISGRPPAAGATHEVRRSDGRVLELQTNPIPEGGGFVVACTDITDRIRTLEALQDSERRIRTYTDNVPVLIAYVGRDERYQFTNRYYEQALGLTREQTQRLTVREALGEERYRRLKPYVDAALAGQHQSFEIEFPSAGVALARGTYIPHRDATGQVAGFFTLYQDITDQRRAETVLREAKETLERRVEERTRELTQLNQELAEAKQTADSANLGKTRFLAAASHDLLQPLHAARLFAATLNERCEDEDEGKLLDQLDDAQGAVEQLLQALLEISKLDAGALTASPRPLAIGEILRSVVASFEPMARDKQLELHLVDSRAVVATDPTLIRRVVQNFISNALRYTRHGRVLVGCRRRGGRLAVEVWDTGRGIAADKLQDIFGEFRRLDADDPETPNGLGLGLAIVERIARMLSHPIEVRSEPGRGSVFSILLPLADAAAPQPLAKPARRGVPNLLAGKRVLCIDNEDSILVAMRGLLEAWSCTVMTATDAAGALACLGAAPQPPDVVVLDYHLRHGESGLEVLDRLNAAAGRQLNAVLLTADHAETVQRMAQSRGLPLLHKPVNPAALRALLSRLATPDEELLDAGD